MFDPVIDLPDYRQIIDNVPTTEDIPIDDDLFSDKENEDNSKQIKDDIWNDINHSEILINMNWQQQQQQLKRNQKVLISKIFCYRKE